MSAVPLDLLIRNWRSGRRHGRWQPTATHRRLGTAVLAAAVAVVAAGGPAMASPDRPVNGPISFGRFDPALGDFTIWAADPDGRHQRRLTHGPSFFSDWSPDGRRIAFDFADESGVHIATMDPTGRNVRQLTVGRGIQEIPKWSPDGQWIVFDASTQFPGEPGFHTDIWIMRADGTHARQLTRGGFDVEPVFSPDGTRIAFSRITRDGDIADVAIYLTRTDGSQTRQIVASTHGLEHLDWTPDGRWLLFNTAPEVPGAAVMAVRPNGTGLHVIRRSDSRYELFKPVSSPDGAKILLGCYDVRAQIDRLCTMTASGGHLRVIIATPDPVNFPAWGQGTIHRDAQASTLD